MIRKTSLDAFVMKLVNIHALEACAKACGFKSHRRHQCSDGETGRHTGLKILRL